MAHKHDKAAKVKAKAAQIKAANETVRPQRPSRKPQPAPGAVSASTTERDLPGFWIARGASLRGKVLYMYKHMSKKSMDLFDLFDDGGELL